VACEEILLDTAGLAESSAEQLIIDVYNLYISLLELLGCKVFPVCTAYVVALKINRKSICQQIYVSKGSKFNFQIVLRILYKSFKMKLLLFPTKSNKIQMKLPYKYDVNRGG